MDGQSRIYGPVEWLPNDSFIAYILYQVKAAWPSSASSSPAATWHKTNQPVAN